MNPATSPFELTAAQFTAALRDHLDGFALTAHRIACETGRGVVHEASVDRRAALEALAEIERQLTTTRAAIADLIAPDTSGLCRSCRKWPATWLLGKDQYYGVCDTCIELPRCRRYTVNRQPINR